MKASHRGHAIEVNRERSMMGDKMLFWSIFRVSDGYECDSGFSTGEDKVAEFVTYLRERVDAELSESDPWGEGAS